jgi:DNA-binding transcriptional MerR regulator
MRKAPEAFRTISEAADALETPAHVLRFWESKFTQVKPVKRAGGRRYYRPADIDLLSGIKLLLHEQGMTIRGVQKLLQEKGARHVAAMAPLSGEALEGAATPILTLVPQSAATEDIIDTQQAAADAPAPSGAAQDPVPEETAELTAQAAKHAPAMLSSDTAPAEVAETDIPHALDDTPEAVADGTSEVLQPSDEDIPPATVESDQHPIELLANEDAMSADMAPAEAEASVSPNIAQAPEDTRPIPALAALLDAAAEGQAAQPLRFATIAHALRTHPPRKPQAHANALARLEALVAKISARAD